MYVSKYLANLIYHDQSYIVCSDSSQCSIDVYDDQLSLVGCSYDDVDFVINSAYAIKSVELEKRDDRANLIMRTTDSSYDRIIVYCRTYPDSAAILEVLNQCRWSFQASTHNNILYKIPQHLRDLFDLPRRACADYRCKMIMLMHLLDHHLIHEVTCIIVALCCELFRQLDYAKYCIESRLQEV